MNKYVKKALKNAVKCNDVRKVFISDAHLGCADNADETVRVNNLMFHALKKYYEDGYTVVCLGDTFELAENHDIEKIKNAHDNIMWILSELYNDGRLIIIRGNHDAYMKEKDVEFRQSQYDGTKIDFLPNIKLYDSLISEKIIAMHGSQCFTIFSCWFNHILISLGHFWKKWQLSHTDYNTCEATGWQDSVKAEQYFSELGKNINKHFIIGHTHKCCFNLDNVTDCGSFGVMRRCITAVEVFNDKKINTVKWASEIEDDGIVKVKKTILGTQNI